MIKKRFNVGYLDCRTSEGFVSSVVINDIFLKNFLKYVNLKVIPVHDNKRLIDILRRAGRARLDYLYIDSFHFLMEHFLIREKWGLDIPFICKLYTVVPWTVPYANMIPLFRKYDIIYAPSFYAKNSFLKITDRRRVHVIPNCLDTAFIRQHISSHVSFEKKIISCMGRITPEKGVGTLIECMPKIIGEVPEAHLHIIGPLSGGGMTDRPKCKYVKFLEERVRNLGLTRRVHFKGVQLDAKKYQTLSQSDLFVNPTTAPEETFGIVNIEALACGLPIVATNWAANKEIIIEDRNGLLVDIPEGWPKNIKPLASAIIKVLKNDTLRQRLKEGALASSRAYDYHRVLPGFVRILKKNPKSGEYRERWRQIKDKTVADCRESFNRDFFFFLTLSSGFRKKSYETLYRLICAPYFKRVKRTEKILKRKKKSMENVGGSLFVQKLRRELWGSLLGRKLPDGAGEKAGRNAVSDSG